MASVLGAGNDSRLVKDLVGARHLVTEISASNGGSGFRYDNLLGFSAVPAGSHSLEEVETAIVQHLEALKSQPVSGDELSAAVAHVVAAAAYQPAARAGSVDPTTTLRQE
jgi:predicted Zn-dependent peptidase